MKFTGFRKNVDGLGRIYLPKELREALYLEDDDLIQIYEDDENIVLLPMRLSCIFCGSDNGLSIFKTKAVCYKCLIAVENSIEEGANGENYAR